MKEMVYYVNIQDLDERNGHFSSFHSKLRLKNNFKIPESNTYDGLAGLFGVSSPAWKSTDLYIRSEM